MIERRAIHSPTGVLLALGFLSLTLTAITPLRSAQAGEQRVIQLRGAEKLGADPGSSKRAAAKVSQDLSALHAEYQAHLKEARTSGVAAPAFQSSNTLAPLAGEAVIIDATASGDPEVLADDLRALGARNVVVFGRMVSARLPLTAIPALEDLPSLRLARPAYATQHQGAVPSQGDRAMRADIARMSFGVDGSGVLVGTLSDSYDCLGGAAAGEASGDLPAGVQVLQELDPCGAATDEGRAMMEIIHDIAPGATLAFHTAFEGQAGFAQGIIELANAGAKVINDDVIFFTEPFFQDGIVAQAVDTVKGLGVAYFSSAGNAGRRAYEAPFRPSGHSFGVGSAREEAHDFDPGPGIDICQRITVPVGRTLTLVYQWDQPFASTMVGAPGSASDMDIFLTNAACTIVIRSGAERNVGGDPVEILGFTNPGPSTVFGVIIGRFSGPDPGLMKTVNLGSGSFDEFDTQTGTSWGHSAALGGLGVGAADYQDTPAFNGGVPPVIESFSSAGGTPILFDIAGNRLASLEDRQQPDITAPDGVDTTFFGGVDAEPNSFPNFFGTSAAAPHAAAVAALMLQRNSSIGPDAVYSILKATAIDMDDPATSLFDMGFDCRTGFGLMEAERALNAALQPAPAPTPSIPAGCFLTPLQPPPPPPPPCNGIAATMAGTDGDDQLTGTLGNDVIHGMGGNDTIAGLEGDDVICGGPGRDRLSGNRGSDRLFGGAGNDVLKGGPGPDRLFGQGAGDTLDGQSGPDRCDGGTGIDKATRCERTTRVP